MSVRTKLADWLLAGRQQQQTTGVRPRIVGRAFDAARVDDLSFGFRSQNSSIDQDLASGLPVLRGRARNLAQNNDHARRFLQMCVANVVGPSGFTLQCQAREGQQMDDLANALIEASFTQWARRGTCDVTGTLSFVDVQALVIETIARDGECLVRRVRGKSAGNTWQYALQVIDIDRLPADHNETLRNGHSVIMGVEVNPVGRPVAYHVLPRHPNGSPWQSIMRAERIPAEDVFHLFRPIRPEQRRGVTWMHTAMMRLEMLGKYEHAALIAARKGAETLGFFVTPTGESPMLDAQDADGSAIATSVPGSFDTLPQGVEVRPFDTKYPSDSFGSFVQWSLRSIASGLGVSYTSISNDLTGVSYSSIRSGVLEERDMWMQIQGWFVEGFLRPVFLDWLQTSLLAGAIGYPTGTSLPVSKLDKFSPHVWQGRRWAWVDPLKDINANIAAVNAGLKSRREVIAEQGRDIDDVWLQLAAERAKAAEMGIDIGDGAAEPDDDEQPQDNIG